CCRRLLRGDDEWILLLDLGGPGCPIPSVRRLSVGDKAAIPGGRAAGDRSRISLRRFRRHWCHARPGAFGVLLLGLDFSRLEDRLPLPRQTGGGEIYSANQRRLREPLEGIREPRVKFKQADDGEPTIEERLHRLRHSQ